ncbi:hypothetical protein [Gelidibacter salicanalis]|uniref:hypothetical protein n=1 Tax=Gelidibacter salicanalis TaxID=291193 RepID=UPI001F409F89|nr:hypothetical protein [Gelidibacter salicanalis]
MKANYISAGNNAPLTTAATGNTAELKEVNRSNFNSPLISSPTNKKYRAVKPSFPSNEKP